MVLAWLCITFARKWTLIIEGRWRLSYGFAERCEGYGFWLVVHVVGKGVVGLVSGFGDLLVLSC